MQQLNDSKELEMYITESIDRDILETNWILLQKAEDGKLYDPSTGLDFSFCKKQGKLVELTFHFLNLDDIE